MGIIVGLEYPQEGFHGFGDVCWKEMRKVISGKGWLKWSFVFWVRPGVSRTYIGGFYSGWFLKRRVLAWSSGAWLSGEIFRVGYLILNRREFWERKVRQRMQILSLNLPFPKSLRFSWRYTAWVYALKSRAPGLHADINFFKNHPSWSTETRDRQELFHPIFFFG
jgi:hypothetical protein